MPARRFVDGTKFVIERDLRYGENPRQGNAVLVVPQKESGDEFAVTNFHQISGADPSYVTYTDLDRIVEYATRLGAAWELNFGHVPCIALGVKHGNACGAAVGPNQDVVVRKLIECDHEAIFGGTVLLNFGMTAPYANMLRKNNVGDAKFRPLDNVIAPAFDQDAIEILGGKSKRCRIFTNPCLGEQGLGLSSVEMAPRKRAVRGGFLTQDTDSYVFEIPDEWLSTLNHYEAQNMVLAWAIGARSNSNSIAIANYRMLVGRCFGDQARHTAAEFAVRRAKRYLHIVDKHMHVINMHAVAYSDSFFPMPDGPQILADAGIKIIFATNGSVQDSVVREYCESVGVRLYTLPDAEARGFFGH